MNRENASELKFMNALDIQTISTDTTTDGDVIDTQGYDSLTFVFQTGTVTDGDYLPLIEESDVVTFGGEESAVADADLTVTEAAAGFTADTDDNQISKIGYTGAKRFVRLAIVSTNTSSGAVVGAIAVLGHGRAQPES